MKPLSKLQKAKLAQLARAAFDYQSARGELSGITADQYRHDECERATGCAGLRECNASHYETLAAHFSDLAGHPDVALNHHLRGESNQRRQLLHVIKQALAQHHLPIEYAASISLDKFHAPIDDLDERQLRGLLVTVKARCRARRRATPVPRPSDGCGRSLGENGTPPRIKGEGHPRPQPSTPNPLN